MKERPLVSMTVICYRAERFVREAIEGALAQTYSPLEIIISDDASTDRTFEIIQEAVADYRGPHRIILNRNERNMGIGAHVSKVWFDIAKGDWIVVSAGDDVSLPHRIERLMELAEPGLGALHHHVLAIDDNSGEIPHDLSKASLHPIAPGETVEDLIKRGFWLKGATMCLNRRMLLRYGRIDEQVFNEDVILGYRAFHFGGVKFVPEPLMKYRVHGGSISHAHHVEETPETFRKRIVQLAKSRMSVMRQVRVDDASMGFSDDLHDFMQKTELHARMDLFLFSEGDFSSAFLWHPAFYVKLVKKLFFMPYWYLIRR